MIAANTTFQRNDHIAQIVMAACEEMRKKIADKDAVERARLGAVSPEEKMRIKRESIILEKRRNDVDYQRASHRMDVLHKERKDACVQKWRMKHGMEHRYRHGGQDSIDEKFEEARKHLDEANARIEREVDEELNAGDTLCC